MREGDFGAKGAQAAAESGFVAVEGAVFDMQGRVRAFNRAAFITRVEGKAAAFDGHSPPGDFQGAAIPSRTVAGKAAVGNVQGVCSAGTGKIDAAPAAGVSRTVFDLAVDDLDLTVTGVDAAAKGAVEALGKGQVIDNEPALGNDKNAVLIIAANAMVIAFNDNAGGYGGQRFGQRDIYRQRKGICAAAGWTSTDGGVLIGSRNRIAQAAILIYCDAGSANLPCRRNQEQ